MINFDRIKILYDYEKAEFTGKKCGMLLNKNNLNLFTPKFLPEFKDVKVLSCDVTKDIFLGEEKESYLSKLALIPYDNLRVTPYKNNQSGELESIVIHIKTTKRGQQSIRLTIYDKYAQSKDPQYIGVLRCEYRLTTFRHIRKGLNISDNNLFEVLHAKINPIDFLLECIYNKIDDTMNKQPTLTQFNEQLFHSYFNELDYNWQQIKDRLKLTGQSPHKIRKVKDLFIKLQIERKAVNYKELFSPLISRQTEHIII